MHTSCLAAIRSSLATPDLRTEGDQGGESSEILWTTQGAGTRSPLAAPPWFRAPFRAARGTRCGLHPVREKGIKRKNKQTGWEMDAEEKISNTVIFFTA